MSEKNLTLLDAIQVAMEAEKQAVTLYSGAAEKAGNEVIHGLFKYLADFEQHHYDKLTALSTSLQKEGKFVFYEGYSLPIPAQGEIKASGKAAKVLAGSKASIMDVITVAQDAEKKANKKYAALAEQTSDAEGKAMFEQLAKEEQSHLDLLNKVYWNANDRGVWAWAPE